MTKAGVMYRFEDDDRLVTFDEMAEDVAFAVEHDDFDGNTVTSFAIWLNDQFTAWDVLGVSTRSLIDIWVEHLAVNDPDELYACTGYREAEDRIRCPCGFEAPLGGFPTQCVRMDVGCVEAIHVCPECGRGF